MCTYSLISLLKPHSKVTHKIIAGKEGKSGNEASITHLHKVFVVTQYVQLIHHERSVSVTSFFKSSAAPAFTSSKVASVLPHLPVSISAVVPHCVVTDIVQ